MIYLPSFLCVLTLLATNVAAQVSNEILNYDSKLTENDILENFNVSNYRILEPSDHPAAHMNVLELIAYHNYHGEKHLIETDDGYIVEAHRITGSNKNPKPDGKPAVFLLHGLLCSSIDWIITGPGRGLGFVLADAGYDVWIGNARGNKYSRKHKHLSTASDSDEYWDFSWHEIGKYDLPATIDYILGKTKNEKITYVGHSQGSTAFFVMLSERPEYNDKVKLMFSLAPIAHCSSMTSPVFSTLAKLYPFIETIYKLIGKNEFQPGNDFFKRFAATLCDAAHITNIICKNVLFLICGYSEEQLDKELLPAILAHTPAGSSVKQFTHFTQLVNSGHFRQFDYGWFGNKRKYGTFTPPAYKFENLRVPIALHYAVNDALSDTRDVEKLYNKLPNAIGKFRVPHNKFNHLDFTWGKDVKHLLYDKMLSLMVRYEN